MGTLRLGLLFINKTILADGHLWCWILCGISNRNLLSSIDLFFWSQVTHPSVHFLSLLFTFDFHILVYNIPILLGYCSYNLLQVWRENLWNSCEQASSYKGPSISKEDRNFRTVSQNWKGN
jgi:hypothetical protein